MGCGRSRRGMIENNESPANPRSVPPELEAVLRRKGYILLVKGDAGTGKTNLALELMALLHSEGDAVHISTRTYPEKLSFQHSLFSKLVAEPNVQFFSTLEFDPTSSWSDTRSFRAFTTCFRAWRTPSSSSTPG